MENLLPEQKEFVRLKLLLGDDIQAVKQAYDIQTDEYAKPKAERLLNNPAIRSALRSASERIPDDLLEDVHIQGLTATTRDKFGNKIPDHNVRHKFLDSGYKLKGAYVAEKKNPDDPVSLEAEGIALEVLKAFVEQSKAIDITPKKND